LVPRVYSPFINNFIIEFQVGVPIFFVLSGFLIGHRYFDSTETLRGGAFNYFINRFIRIIPLYLVITILNILWYKLNNREALLNLTLLHGFFSDVVFDPLPHTWSLTVELTFYILVPFIFFLIRKRVDVLLQSLLFLIIGLLITYYINRFPIDNFWGNYWYMLLLTFFGRSFEFLLGVKFALYIKSSNSIKSVSPALAYISFIVFVIIMLTLSMVGGLKTYFGVLIHNLIIPICIVVMMYGLIASRNLFTTLLSTPVFQLLGNSSYAFFLIHYGFWQKFMVKYLFIDLFMEFLATIVLSIVLYKFFEEPLIRLVKNKFQGRSLNDGK